MAKGSEQVSFAKYGVRHECYGCGRKVTLSEHLWFRGGPHPGVFGRECFRIAARSKAVPKDS